MNLILDILCIFLGIFNIMIDSKFNLIIGIGCLIIGMFSLLTNRR